MTASLLFALAVAAIGCDSTAYRNGASQAENPHAVSRNADSPRAANPGAAATSDKTGAVEHASQSARYRIDAGQSRLTARVFVGGLFSAFGHDHTISIRDFTGDVQLTPGTIEPASLRMTIKASSAAEIEKEFSEKDRRKIDRSVREEALVTDRYPEIVFKSTKISATKTSEGEYQTRLAGDLTLHGVTRPIVVPAQVTLSGNGMRARGEFAVRHSDYQIKRLSGGAGTVKAKDEMKLSFDIVAHKY